MRRFLILFAIAAVLTTNLSAWDRSPKDAIVTVKGHTILIEHNKGTEIIPIGNILSVYTRTGGEQGLLVSCSEDAEYLCKYKISKKDYNEVLRALKVID